MKRALIITTCIAALDMLGACRGGATGAAYSGPISGILVHAEGATAPLGTNGTSGTGFALTATLGNVVIVAPAGASWECFAPQPPLYPDYNILAVADSSFIFSLVVTSSHWHSGTVAVDNSNVLVQLVLSDRFGIGTNGTLTLTTGSACAFQMEGVQLSGDEEPAQASGNGGGGGGP